MTRRVLMIAYHYPPVGMSSGVHRTLAFSRYLIDHGWEPVVLSINPAAYSRLSDDQLADIPGGLHVERAAGFDSAKRFSVMGHYPQLLALPDRWVSWYFGGVSAGKRLIKSYKPQVIWSTYPIATAQLIALRLQSWSGLPWLADFRDSMVDDGYPEAYLQRKAFEWVERTVVNNANACVFTTNGTFRMYSQRYPQVNPEKWKIIANGFDENAFQDATQITRRYGSLPLRFLHSGLLSLTDRDPRPFFSALSDLKKLGKINSSQVQFIFRASSDEEMLGGLTKTLDISDLVMFESPLPYRKALSEMLACDGLLIFQGASCNHQIPAKVYEYLRAKRPIFALTNASSDTAKMLCSARVGQIADIVSISSIKKSLLDFIRDVKKGEGRILRDEEVIQYSRKSRAQELAELLNLISTR